MSDYESLVSVANAAKAKALANAKSIELAMDEVKRLRSIECLLVEYIQDVDNTSESRYSSTVTSAGFNWDHSGMNRRLNIDSSVGVRLVDVMECMKALLNKRLGEVREAIKKACDRLSDLSGGAP